MLHKQKSTWRARVVPLRFSFVLCCQADARTRGHVMFPERTHSKMAASAAIRFPTSRTTTLHASFSFLFYLLQFAIYVFYQVHLVARILQNLLPLSLIRDLASSRPLHFILFYILKCQI